MGGYSTRQQKVTTRIMNEAKWKSLEKTSRRLRSADKLIVWMVRIKTKVVFSTCEDLTYMPLKCDLCNMTNVMLEMLLSRCDVWALSTQTREVPSIQISTATAWAEIQTSLQTLKDCVCVHAWSFQVGWWHSFTQSKATLMLFRDWMTLLFLLLDVKM